MPEAPQTLHASCVAVAGRGLLILGPSGAGKSALAIQLIALGARLVADDRVLVTVRGEHLVASCPDPIRGLIEARGIGLLRCDSDAEATLHLAVDLARPAADRLPEPHGIVLSGRRIDLVPALNHAHFPAALLLYLRGGRAA